MNKFIKIVKHMKYNICFSKNLPVNKYLEEDSIYSYKIISYMDKQLNLLVLYS